MCRLRLAPICGARWVAAFAAVGGCVALAGCTGSSPTASLSAPAVRVAVAEAAAEPPSTAAEDAIIARAIAEHEMRRP